MKRLVFTSAPMLALAAILMSATPAAAPIIIPITAGFDCHTQGFTIIDNNLVVSCAERIKQRALLLRYRLPENFPAVNQRLSNPEVIDLTRGSQWHPSGVDNDGKILWLAVADYRAKLAKSTILALEPANLKPVAEFKVNDHIGTIAVVRGEIWGFNWDSVLLYRWGSDGRQISRAASPAKVAFQDCDGGDDFALCSGPDPTEKRAAAVERISVKDGKAVAERVTTLSVPGQTLGREGFAVLPDGRLAFLPEDLPRTSLVVVEK